jgi:hypothetical protein
MKEPFLILGAIVFLLIPLQVFSISTIEDLDNLAAFSFAIMSDHKGKDITHSLMAQMYTWIKASGDSFVVGLGDHLAGGEPYHNPFLEDVKPGGDLFWNKKFYPNIADGENAYFGSGQSDYGAGGAFLDHMSFSSKSNVVIQPNGCEYYAVVDIAGFKIHIIQLYFSDSPVNPTTAFTENTRQFMVNTLNSINKTENDIIIVGAHSIYGEWVQHLSPQRQQILLSKADLVLSATTHFFKRFNYPGFADTGAICLNTGSVSNAKGGSPNGYIQVHVLRNPTKIIVHYHKVESSTRVLADNGYSYIRMGDGRIKDLEIGDIIVDNTLPSVPQNLTATPNSESQISLSWDPADDPETGIHEYRIYRDDVRIGESQTTSFVDMGLSEMTLYTYKVSAVNGCRVEGTKSAPVSSTTLPDTIPPCIDTVVAFSDPNKAIVTFSENVDPLIAQNPISYSIQEKISGTSLAIQSATIGADQRTVTLSTNAHTESITYTLTVNNITDVSQSQNIILSNSTADYQFILRLNVSLVDYYGTDTPPFVVDTGFKEGTMQSIDRSTDQQWTNVPSVLSGLTYLLTARDDRDNSDDENKVFYRVNCSAPCSVFALVKQSSTVPVWISAEGWQSTSLSLLGNHNTYSVYKKYFPSGNIDLKRQKSIGEGTGYVFKLSGVGSVMANKRTPRKAPRVLEICPNPFSPETEISFFLNEMAHVNISIYNLQGKKLHNLCQGIFRAGRHRRTWRIRDNRPSLPAGLYFIGLRTGKQLTFRKVILLK